MIQLTKKKKKLHDEPSTLTTSPDQTNNVLTLSQFKTEVFSRVKSNPDPVNKLANWNTEICFPPCLQNQLFVVYNF